MKKARFKVGQVVRVVAYTEAKWRGQRYQKITKVWPWSECKKSPFGYTLANKDNCNEKYLAPLTTGEAIINSELFEAKKQISKLEAQVRELTANRDEIKHWAETCENEIRELCSTVKRLEGELS